MTTLAEMWTDYRESVIPDNIEETRLNELRTAFHAGAICLFTEFYKIANEEPSKKGIVDAYESIMDEIAEYVKSIEPEFH